MCMHMFTIWEIEGGGERKRERKNSADRESRKLGGDNTADQVPTHTYAQVFSLSLSLSLPPSISQIVNICMHILCGLGFDRTLLVSCESLLEQQDSAAPIRTTLLLKTATGRRVWRSRVRSESCMGKQHSGRAIMRPPASRSCAQPRRVRELKGSGV
jgi:hypothetical protein